MAMASLSVVTGTEAKSTHLPSQTPSSFAHFLHPQPDTETLIQKPPILHTTIATEQRNPNVIHTEQRNPNDIAAEERNCNSGLRPNSFRFREKLRDVGVREAISEGILLHAQIIYMGYGTDVLLCNLLIQMYGRCKCNENAYWVFESMPYKNVFTWTLFMGALISSGMIDSAQNLFNYIPNPDTTCWSLLISGFSQCGRDQEALDLFDSMILRGFEPDAFTFVSAIAACAHLGDVKKCRKMHVFLASHGLDSDKSLSNALINMYSKSGSLEETKKVFNKIEDRSFTTWNALIGVYVKIGNVAEAFKVFDWMRCFETIPDEITFVTLLNACTCEMILAMVEMLIFTLWMSESRQIPWLAMP